MDFKVYLNNCALPNSEQAKLREATRMVMLAWCLRELGHRVSVPMRFTPSCVTHSARYFHEPFKGLSKSESGDVRIEADYGPADVVVKTGGETYRDQQVIQNCRVLLAVEYDLGIHGHPRLLPVPFPVNDDVVAHFIEEGTILPFLRNDLHRFRADPPAKQVIGFIGNGTYGRQEQIARLRIAAAGRYEFETIFYDSPPFSPAEYMRRCSRWSAGIVIGGVIPKTFRFSELALLGVPMICCRKDWQPVEPELSPENCILLNDWDDAASLHHGMKRLNEIRVAADDAYKSGWSIMGQARKLVERLQ